MPDIVALGEPLVDFISTRTGVSLRESDTFFRSPGGGPANIAVGITRLGGSAGLIGKVGDDAFGHFLAQELAANGVDVTGLRFDPRARTALAFAALDAQNKPDFTFYRENSAGRNLLADEIEEEYIARAKIVVFSALSLIAEPSRSAVLAAVALARKHHVLVAYDPQLRLGLWRSPLAARRGMRLGWELADLVKTNLEEIEFLQKGRTLSERVDRLWTEKLKLLAVTLGAEGCWYRAPRGEGSLAGVRVPTVDTTGAGDAFMAALLVRIVQSDWPRDELDREEWAGILQFANVAAALTTTRRGAIPALPTIDQVRDYKPSET